MPRFSSFLSKKYLATHTAPRSLRIILMLCYLGIGIGAFSLMTTLIITHGFEQEIGKKMKGISSDVIISAGRPIAFAPLERHVGKWLKRWVKGMSPQITRHALLEHNDAHSVLFLRGIDPMREARTTSLESKLILPYRGKLARLLKEPGSVVLGKRIALNNNIRLGQTIAILAPEPTSRSNLSLEKHEATVTGIFSIGLEEYDANAAYCSLATMQSFYSDAKDADQIALTFSPPPPPPSRMRWWRKVWYRLRQAFMSSEWYAARQLKKVKLLLSGLYVRSWAELYPGLMSSLTLEKYAMTIVLALIALVASMLMICLLFMFIQNKKRDIAILRAMGASEKDIYRLFSRIGMRITLMSVVSGLTLSGVLGWWIKAYKPIRLPDVYYVSYLPAALEPVNFAIIFFVTLILSWLACRVPLQQLKRFSISEILRSSN